MDTKIITKINYALSSQNLATYDLLLALGKKELVPNNVLLVQRTRTINRDGKETPEGYLRNAIEDLSKVNFKYKSQIISLLQQQIGSNTLSGFGQTDQSPLTLLHVVYSVLPIVFGADKFFNKLTNWEKFLAPQVAQKLPWIPSKSIKIIGAIEIATGILTALSPVFGGYLVALWFALMTGNLVLNGDYNYAVQDVGLMVGAFSLARLSTN